MLLKIKYSFCLIVITAYLSQNVIGQNIDSANYERTKNLRHFSVIGAFQRGHVFSTNEFLAGSNLEHEKISTFQTIAIKIGNQTNGNESWHVNYNYPFLGGGIYFANFLDTKEVGNPIALFGFFSAPFVRHNKFMLNYDLELGFAFNWKPFNPINNPNNISIGAKQSFYLDAGLNVEYRISKTFSLNAGFSLSHFSNGALKKPNFGINTIAPKISLKYNLYTDKIDYSIREIPSYTKQNELIFSIFTGVKNIIYDSLDVDQVTKYRGVFFPVFGFSSSINRQLNHKTKFGLGFSIGYDGSHNAQVTIDHGEIEEVHSPFKDKLEISLYPSYELVINRMSLLIQPSFYLIRQKSLAQTPMFYQRVGLKYHFNNNMFIGMNLNAFQFHVSDFLEWHFGYRIDWKKK